ncbi:MAG TPA: DUF5808 domain-containing protein [Gaiellaceae bacterium]|nr:DUF5808 domain-containing protein [Gaiellaceae bacterium]
MQRIRKLAGALAFVLAAVAVVTELRKPAGERTWHGRVLGFVPYDFRLPTLERIRSAWWAPDDSRILTDRAFGVGWAVNLGRIFRLARKRAPR